MTDTRQTDRVFRLLFILLSLSVTVLSGCANLPERKPMNAELQEVATIPGIGDFRQTAQLPGYFRGWRERRLRRWVIEWLDGYWNTARVHDRNWRKHRFDSGPLRVSRFRLRSPDKKILYDVVYRRVVNETKHDCDNYQRRRDGRDANKEPTSSICRRRTRCENRG